MATPDETWRDQLGALIRPASSDAHASIRNCGDPRAIDILDEALAVGVRTGLSDFRCNDIVHNDFHASNLLVRGDRVVAVFDWEGARAGDSRADLTTLAWCLDPSEDHVDPQALALIRAEVETIQPEVRAALAAEFAIGKLAFAVGAGPQTLAHIIQLAETWLRPQWR